MSDACSNCGEPHGPTDVFCESCGLDFLTGSLPEMEPAVTSISAGASSPEVGAGVAVATITADAAFHARMDPDALVPLPDPPPAPVTIPLMGAVVLIGRARPSRGVFPDIDLSADGAASSRHARLDRVGDGSWTVTDLGSTNGTYLGEAADPLAPDVAVPVPEGTPIYCGAWTRIEIT